MVNAISGRNLPVLKFAYQLLKPWTAFHQRVPFTKKRPRKPEDWYQLWDITNGTRISVWNILTGKTELPFQTEVFRCKDPKSCVPFTFPLDFPETFWKQAVLLQVAVYYKSWLSNADLRWTLSFFLLPGNQAFNKSLKKTKFVTLLLSKCKEGTNARSLQQSQRVFASFGKLKLNKCIFASDIFLSSFQVFMVFSNYILPQKPVAQTPSLLFCKSCFDAHTILINNI